MYFCRPLKALPLSRIFVEFSLELVYTTMVMEDFQVYGVQITGKNICGSKNLV